ncbi:methyltransferase family protein [Uliginosibacterium gangwonense]|uniref:methyltransferase family protein n=1 Tax=Uliginosibacterium gangwonense TaxID=392736 RepID=UPI0003806779|nr:isoprenylcysteine carboxylmethyltransferase family protein [Uliginosibacterium gangwonense]
MLARITTTRFAKNYFSTLALMLSGWYICFYLSPFHQGILRAFATIQFFQTVSIHIPVYNLFIAVLIAYAIILVPYYAFQPYVHAKAWTALRGLYLGLGRWHRPTPTLTRKGRRRKSSRKQPVAKALISHTTRQAALALLLKFFFAPLMINWCLAHIGDMLHNVELVRSDVQQGVTGRGLFDHALFMAAFQLILFVDTLLFTLGYIIEMPRWKNRIISVEPSLLGWLVCLACYPPFNALTGRAFAWQSADFPHFANDTIHLLANCSILLLMGIYSWASIALGLKASNLTNRGIVCSGPYAFVRHPAYTAKNLAWWIGALPTFYMAFGQGVQALGLAVLCTAAWSLIYAARAITEEHHLLRANNGYKEYMLAVRWRFIPGVI